LLGGFAALIGMGAFGLGLDACSQQSVEATLRSLQASSEVTFVCRGLRTDPAEAIPGDRGFELDQCPDFSATRTREALAVVTQTATNELAVVSIDEHKVVDVDASVPGYTFLRLPGRPGDIVSTPGGEASFVGITSPGRSGITAVPTTCLGPPRTGQHERDLTTFVSCSLPSAPGDMTVVVDPPAPDGTIAETCADRTTPQTEVPPGALRDFTIDAATDKDACTGLGAAWDEVNATCHIARDCVADLTTEQGPSGRRKLVVTLPDVGQLAVIDAQELLDRRPGTFEPCHIEAVLDLDATPDASGQKEERPSDFPPESSADAERCMPAEPTQPPMPPSARSRPSGLAQSAGRLYVGDLGVPAVHVVDASLPCAPKELPPLLPLSFATPSRSVTTSRVAVSPVTPAGKQYVYAVDADDQPTPSVMAFDVSEGVTARTPIVRTGSLRQPREAPDRIAFAAPVADITFAYRDLPKADLETGVAEIGVRCDPTPNAVTDPPTPGVQYRTTSDFSQGARPGLLRGLFGLVLLTSGQVVVIDIDDFDATCRRPTSTNPSEAPDFRGCAGDDPAFPYLTYAADGSSEPGTLFNATPTVSNEASCNMVEPHRVRSAAFGVSTSTLGLGAPSLRGFPQYASPPSVQNQTLEDRPKLMAVPFEPAEPGPDVPPVVYVGTTLYGGPSGTELVTDPSSDEGDKSSLTLPLVEPRSYPSNDRSILTYEGRVLAGDQPSGFVDEVEAADGSGLELRLADATAYFCNQGVYDRLTMQGYAEAELGLSSDAARSFAEGHSDYVQITGDFPSLIDSYWASALAPAGGRAACEDLFGPPPRPGDPELDTNRDLSVIDAYQDHLKVEIRNKDTGVTPTLVKQCFPGGFRYTVRGSNQWVLATTRPDVRHDIKADASQDYRCVRDCDPRKRFFRSRVFEIARIDECHGPIPPGAKEPDCSGVDVGLGSELDGPCRYDPIVDPDAKTLGTRGLTLADGAKVCIFENLTSRFAVYRGRQPSVRDMTFAWDTAGGFIPLVGSLAAVSSGVMPQHLAYVSQYQAIAVVDAANLGFSLMSLDSLRIADPWPVY
jgi:hypothetical protein